MTLTLLAIAYPDFKFTYEYPEPGSKRLTCVARRKDSRQPGVHTVITDNLDELVAALGDSRFWKFPNLQSLVNMDARCLQWRIQPNESGR